MGATAATTPSLLGTAQASTPFSRVGAVAAGAIFVLLATLPYAGAAVYSVAGGTSARARFDELHSWLIVHNRTIIGVVGIVIGLALPSEGAAALL